MRVWCPGEHCRHDNELGGWVIVREGHHVLVIVQDNGGVQVKVHCDKCERGTGSLPKGMWESLRGMEIRVDDRRGTRKRPPCSVEGCDQPGYERHHWAPKNIFGWEEAEKWPTAYLCRPHHREWHARMDGYRRNARGVA